MTDVAVGGGFTRGVVSDMEASSVSGEALLDREE